MCTMLKVGAPFHEILAFCHDIQDDYFLGTLNAKVYIFYKTQSLVLKIDLVVEIFQTIRQIVGIFCLLEVEICNFKKIFRQYTSNI